MTPEDEQRQMIDQHRRTQFRRFITRIAVSGYIFGLAVGCVLTIWICGC